MVGTILGIALLLAFSGQMDPAEVLQRCPLPPGSGEPVPIRELVHDELMRGPTTKPSSTSFRTRSGPSGSGKYLTTREFDIDAETCRTIALQLDCIDGAPDCTGTFFSSDGHTLSSHDRERLLFRQRISARNIVAPAHQSALAPWLKVVSDGPRAAVPRVRVIESLKPRWVDGHLRPQEDTFAEIEAEAEEESLSLEPLRPVGPRLEVHRASRFVLPLGSFKLRDVRLALFETRARPVQRLQFLAIGTGQRSAWLARGAGTFEHLGTRNRATAWFTFTDNLERTWTLIAVDLRSGELTRYAVAGESPMLNSDGHGKLTKKGIELRHANKRRMLISWSELDDAHVRAPGHLPEAD